LLFAKSLYFAMCYENKCFFSYVDIECVLFVNLS